MHLHHMSCSMTKPTKRPMRPAKTQMSIAIRSNRLKSHHHIDEKEPWTWWTSCWTVLVPVHSLALLHLLQETVRSLSHRLGPLQACNHETDVPWLSTGIDSHTFPNAHHDWLCLMLWWGRQKSCRCPKFVLGISLWVALLLNHVYYFFVLPESTLTFW